MGCNYSVVLILTCISFLLYGHENVELDPCQFDKPKGEKMYRQMVQIRTLNLLFCLLS